MAPGIFWRVPSEDIPETCVVQQKDSETGDVCHHNIQGWPKNEVRQYFKKVPLTDFLICADGGTRPITRLEAERLCNEFNNRAIP